MKAGETNKLEGSGVRLYYSVEGTLEQFFHLIMGTSTSPFTTHHVALSIEQPNGWEVLEKCVFLSLHSTGSVIRFSEFVMKMSSFSVRRVQGSAQGAVCSQQNHMGTGHIPWAQGPVVSADVGFLGVSPSSLHPLPMCLQPFPLRPRL